jgi:hypothetical protein
MLILVAILSISVYGMIAAMLGTMLPSLSRPAKRHHAFWSTGGIDDRFR